MSAKYIFVTGGVVSSLGKGLAAASIGCLLDCNIPESASFKPGATDLCAGANPPTPATPPARSASQASAAAAVIA